MDKDKEEEIGVLIALGNSRGKILFQLFSETIILCIIALLLALIVTMLILGPVGALAGFLRFLPQLRRRATVLLVT